MVRLLRDGCRCTEQGRRPCGAARSPLRGTHARHPCDLHTFATGQQLPVTNSTHTTHVRTCHACRPLESGYRTDRKHEGPSSRRSDNLVLPFSSPPLVMAPPPSKEPARAADAAHAPRRPPPGKPWSRDSPSLAGQGVTAPTPAAVAAEPCESAR